MKLKERIMMLLSKIQERRERRNEQREADEEEYGRTANDQEDSALVRFFTEPANSSPGRVSFSIVCYIFLFFLLWGVVDALLYIANAILYFVLKIETSLLDYIGIISTVLSLALLIRITSRTLKFFMNSVPEVTGLGTINLLNGNLRPYGPGMHFRYPWEQIKEGNYINFRLTRREFTETYPAKDGPALKIKWFFQYRPNLILLGRYIAVDQDVIDRGLSEVGSSFLLQEIGVHYDTAEDCKENFEQIEANLKKRFETAVADLKKEGANLGIPIPKGKAGGCNEEECTLEWLYGINIIRVGISDLDFEESYQKARASKAIAVRLKEIAAGLKRETDKSVTDKDTLNAAMIINGNTTKNIQEVEGQGGEALAALLMAMARGGK